MSLHMMCLKEKNIQILMSIFGVNIDVTLWIKAYVFLCSLSMNTGIFL